MKNLFLSLTVAIMALPALGAAKREVLKGTATVDIGDLRCEIMAGSGGTIDQRQSTIVGGRFKLPVSILHDNGIVELTHDQAQTQGCDLAELDKIAIAAINTFSHLIDAPIEVIKETSESRLTTNGDCVATYNETVKIDIGEGIVLENRTGEQIAANDCAVN